MDWMKSFADEYLSEYSDEYCGNCPKCIGARDSIVARIERHYRAAKTTDTMEKALVEHGLAKAATKAETTPLKKLIDAIDNELDEISPRLHDALVEAQNALESWKGNKP
jgi:hypothetical protein